MERKSMGTFIAALRKANGFTQKELAEKLHVSDKSVSRWERDESAPDLSLIPVIAEIFRITSDELLRGERKAATQQEEEKPYPKAEKQRQRILAASMAQYKTRSLLAVGLALTGLMGAMVANFGFNRAYIGFFVGAIFYLAAVICQAIWVNSAFFSVTEEEMAGQAVENFKRSVISVAQRVISAVIVLLCMCLPLLIYPIDTYMGLTAESWLLQGALPYGAAAALLCAVVCCALTQALQKRGVYTLAQKEKTVYEHNFKLKRSCAWVLLGLLFFTCIGHAAATGGGDAMSVAQGTLFEDFDTFKAYMEQDIPAQDYSAEGFDNAPAQLVPGSEVQYYDEQGNPISEEQALRCTLTDSAGNVLCEYINRNQTVSGMRYGHANGNPLPITVFTQEDLWRGRQKINEMNAVFAVVYLAETIGVTALYFKKRAK